MVLEAVVDPNVLSCPVPIIMRERGEVVRQDKTSLYPLGETEPTPRGSGEAESIPQPSGETEPALKASGETETSPGPSGETEPTPKASGEVEPSSCHSREG